MQLSSKFKRWGTGWAIVLSFMLMGYLTNMMLTTPHAIPTAAVGLLFLAVMGVLIGELLGDVDHP